MSELTLTVMRLGFLAVLWLFVIVAVQVIRSDLFGAKGSPRTGRRAAAAAAPAAPAGAPARPQPGPARPPTTAASSSPPEAAGWVRPSWWWSRAHWPAPRSRCRVR